MSTAPVPNLIPIPGMNQGNILLAGDAANGGANANANEADKDKGNSDPNKDGEDATGGENGSDGCGDPVCPITGKVFLDVLDFAFGGPLPLRWIRHYNSRSSHRSTDLGYGWSHPFGWTIELHARRAIVSDAKGREQEFDRPPDTGLPVKNGMGWSLYREGNRLWLRLPEGLRHGFDPVGGRMYALTAVVDRNGNTIAIARDAHGRITGLTDSAGRPYRVRSDAAGRIVSIEVACNAAHSEWLQVASYAYDEHGDLVRFTDAEEYDWRHRYDGHLMVEHRTPCGLSYCYRWAKRGPKAQCVETWGEYIGSTDPALEHPLPVRPAGRDTRKVKGINYVRLTFSAKERYSEAENGLGGVERFFGDAKGRIVKRVTPSGGIWQTVYDPNHGEVVLESSPDGSVRTVEHNADGEPLAVNDGFGGRVDVFKDPDGLVVRFDRENDAVERRAYDERDNVTYVEHADGSREQYALDPRGLVTYIIDRLGARTVLHHDAMGNCVCVEKPNGDVEVSEYDYLGRRIAHVDGGGRRTEWRYDRRSECVYKRHADGSEIFVTRDGLRNQTRVEDAGRVTLYEYGGLGWLTKVVSPGGTAVEYRYDVEGNLTWIRNARGQIYRQWFDVASRPIACETFEGVRLEVGYDVADRPRWTESPIGREAREYDAQDRLVGVELPDGRSIALQYLPDRTLAFGEGPTRVERQLDAVDQIVRDKQGAHETRIRWNVGQVAIIKSDVGAPIRNERGPSGALTKMTAGSTTVRFEGPAGGGVLTLLGDSLVLRRKATPTGKLEAQYLARYNPNTPREVAATHSDPNLLHWRRYEYDLAQNLIAEHRSDGRTIRYELTRDDQVAVRRIYRGATLLEEERYAYDACGTPVIAGARYDAAMRPTELRGERFEYDEVGRLSRRTTDAGVWRYEWSATGELIRVIAPDRVVEMDYDATGRRLRKRVLRSGELVRSTSYVWSNHAPLHEVNDLDGTTRTFLRAEHVWEPLGHVDIRAGVESAVFYVNDSVGALDFAVDARGTVVFAGERGLWGHLEPTVSSVPVHTRFPNQFWDADVELVYNLRRWYEPRLGLFVSPDPALLDGTLNPRDYAPNPLRYVDPTGLTQQHPGPTSNDQWPANGHARRPGVPDKSDFGPNGDYLLGPGHWATEGAVDERTGKFVPGYATVKSTDANAILQTEGGRSKKWPKSVQDAVDAAGKKFGCHSCGKKSPGKQAHFTPDHQPLASQVKATPNEQVGELRLYPHCRNCSNAQKNQASKFSRENTKTDMAAEARAASGRNMRHGPIDDGT